MCWRDHRRHPTPPAPESSCPPAPDRLLVPPVGAAWIGSFEGVFETDDGRPPFAVWSIAETLVGGPLGEDDQLFYTQPLCDAVLSGGIGDGYLVRTADPTSPTTDDTVLWRIDPGDHVALMFSDLATPLSIYGVETLDAARALVLSGDMPTGQVPSPSVAPGPSDDADRSAARSALQDYYDDVEAHRYQEAWDRLSPQTQAMWGDFEAFDSGSGPTNDFELGATTNEHDALCLWMTMGPTDFGDADLSRAWLIEVTHGPIATSQADEWIVARLRDGSWSLWQVR
jgi:hypothetical protein